MDAMSPGFAIVALMWATMMVAMMVPSAAPTVLLYARAQRHARPDARPPTATFVTGYLLCWLAFALLAAGLQITRTPLRQVMSGMSMALPAEGGAIVMIRVGPYTTLPSKNACSDVAGPPRSFPPYRPGAAGELRLGLLTAVLRPLLLVLMASFCGGIMTDVDCGLRVGRRETAPRPPRLRGLWV